MSEQFLAHSIYTTNLEAVLTFHKLNTCRFFCCFRPCFEVFLYKIALLRQTARYPPHQSNNFASNITSKSFCEKTNSFLHYETLLGGDKEDSFLVFGFVLFESVGVAADGYR